MKTKKKYPVEVYLNDQWMPSQEATVSVFDRSFMFADGIYEVTPFYNGKPFRIEDHVARVKYCLQQMNIDFDISALHDFMLEAVERSTFSKEDAAVYLQISRGMAPRSHFIPQEIKPTLLLYAFQVNLADFEDRHWKVMASEDFRWHRCDIKSTALLANTMANDAALSAGYDENLLFRNGHFTEGSHTTIFFVKNKTVYTHPEGRQILSGITRKVVLELCRDLDIVVKEEAFPVSGLKEVDEIFLTGTTTQIAPVSSVTIEGKEMFASQKGEITARLQEEFVKRTRER
ncbi:D-alanine aminotransferase [Salinimicrobium marinum]|uniref:D-alanine aminotransferase n=1 Tax=Salinimicrobium marinum TaxID=680283 RepID=A0A918SFP1_9FLAO|nr:aminotransferase class IV [Salinimicrobium marinum]GHA39546.1 D-alanine aminotransferase [Salinimicrobium marinum]